MTLYRYSIKKKKITDTLLEYVEMLHETSGNIER